MDALIVSRTAVGITGALVLAAGIRMLWKGSKNIRTSAYIVLGSAAVEYALRLFSRLSSQNGRPPAVNEGTLGAGMTALAVVCIMFISVHFALELICLTRKETVKNGILKSGKERAAVTAFGIVLACLVAGAIGGVIWFIPNTFDAMKAFASGDIKRAGITLCLTMLEAFLLAAGELFVAEFPEPRERQKAIGTLDELIEGEQKYREEMKALMAEYRKKGISCRALDELCLDLMSESLMKQSEYTAKRDAMRGTH